MYYCLYLFNASSLMLSCLSASLGSSTNYCTVFNEGITKTDSQLYQRTLRPTLIWITWGKKPQIFLPVFLNKPHTFIYLWLAHCYHTKLQCVTKHRHENSKLGKFPLSAWNSPLCNNSLFWYYMEKNSVQSSNMNIYLKFYHTNLHELKSLRSWQEFPEQVLHHKTYCQLGILVLLQS